MNDLSQPTPAPLSDGPPPLVGFDASLFKSSHLLHVQDDAIFTHDHHLIINPEEMMPEHEPLLISKIIRHFSTSHPSFYSYPARAHLALGLASYIPLSQQARKETLIAQAKELYVAEKTGQHPEDQAAAHRHDRPMTSYIEGYQSDMKVSPTDKELHANGLSAYLLINEALKRHGFQKEAAHYVASTPSVDGQLLELGKLLDLPAESLIASMRDGGLDGLAGTLGIDTLTRDDIKAIAAYSADQFFSSNLIHNWLAGRSIAAMKHAPLSEAIETGKLARVARTVESARTQIASKDKSTIDSDTIQDHIVATLRDMPLPLQQALYLTGTEISATPFHNVTPLLGQPETALGQHWFLPFSHGSNEGTRHLYISGADHLARFSSVLQHEAHHFTFPASFSASDLASMDQLLSENTAHLKSLNALCEAWVVATPDERKSVEAEIDDQFKTNGTSLQQALGGQINDASMHRLAETTNHATSELDPASPKLSRSYPSPESRAAEMISRFASIKYVDLRDAPDMLRFICPKMETLYHQFYLPHLEREVQKLQQPKDESLPLGSATLAATPHLMADLAAGKFGPSEAYDWQDSAPSAVVEAMTATSKPLLDPVHHLDAKSDPTEGFASRIAEQNQRSAAAYIA